MSRFLNLLAALASFGAFAMLIQWGFTLSTLDPSDIPVIKKAEGPARVAPDDPGGEIVGTQGLALNAIQSKGAAESTSEQVVLAPRAEPFQPEDVAGIDIENRLPEATEAAANVEEIIADALKNDVQGTLTMASELSEDLKKADETAMAKAKALFGITDDAQTGEEVVAKTATPEVVEEKPTEVAQTPENDPLAIRPKRRPSELKAVAKVEPEAPEAPKTAPKEVVKVAAVQDSNKPKAGTPVIQLGAYLSDQIADSEWGRLSSRHGDLLGKFTRYKTTTVAANGKTYHRLRLHGFADDAEAKSLCVAIKARGADCLFAREK